VTSKNVIRSFSIGAALVNGQFTALIIKFRFEDQSKILCSFGRNQVLKLLQALSEYIQYLNMRNVQYDADAQENILKDSEPGLTKDDVELPPVTSVVSSISGVVKKSHDMELLFGFHGESPEQKLVLKPVLSEWLLGYVSNTLNEFDEEGNLLKQTNASH
jgi:hypothetical protein